MTLHILESLATTLIGAGCLLLPASGLAQRPPVDPSGGRPPGGAAAGIAIPASHLDVYVRDVDGGPISQMALVTVTKMSNQYWRQITAQAGRASFDNVASGRYTVQVVAPGYVKAVEDVDVIGSGGSELIYVTMKPESPGGEPTPVVAGPPVLAPKAQKELGKALEALRASKFAEARAHLDAVYHLKKALELEPNSWRAHALLADADLRLGSSEEAVREAERAVELGQERAAGVRPML